jgi:transcription-repair coupling factor (superfamily II helicase)
MQLQGLLGLIDGRAWLDRAQPHAPVPRAARPFALAALAAQARVPIMVVTAQIKRAYTVAEQLPVWLGPRAVYRFAEPLTAFYERAAWGDAAIRARLETLAALSHDQHITPPIVVTSARALMQRTMPPNSFIRHTLTLQPRQRVPLGTLLQRLAALGYEATPIVVEMGSFSRRGGIVDVFPVAADQPVRIEFWDDEIDSLRAFDPATQRSTARLDSLMIPPAREVLPSDLPPISAHLADWFAAARAQGPAQDRVGVAADADALAAGAVFPMMEHYLPYVYAHTVSLLDYAPPDALIVVEDWDELRDTAQEIDTQAAELRAAKIAQGALPPDFPPPLVAWQALADALQDRHILRLDGDADNINDGLRPTRAPLFTVGKRYGGQLKPLLTEIAQLRRAGDAVVLVAPQAERLAELWREQETFLAAQSDVIDTPERGALHFVHGTLSEGWSLATRQGFHLHVLTDAEIFGWSRHEPRRRKNHARRQRTPETLYADLKHGDYVVHVDYGIGRFAGISSRTIDDVQSEYMVIQYAGTDMLFVPIHQADRLTRYVGPDDRPPTLQAFGGGDWARVRDKTKLAVQEEAQALLALYAQRAAVPGHAFSTDSHFQHEMEAAFPYVETEDQLKALRAVKEDMERPYPMDRLICGDVGFGKTEVAIRAAFKAVMDGYQVAVLVPTTVLAQQHYHTFIQRLGTFPVRVEALSRFRSKAEQDAILRQLAAGEVDIIIGTHRLLSDDVTFKQLGLAVVDEEQRFGVKHKEHFKRLRTKIDVLTLSATPIPRTLYMGLTGVRDISMIQTPPEERLPVLTHVGAFDEALVRQAILRELERGGQVFFLHNRVNTLDLVRQQLEELVPEARIISAHGQMDERLLERAMETFALGEYDILLCTSIVESGLDIPNANTLIIDRAELFGMAQLYQLRGRVGRSAQQAFAYFFYHGKPSQEAYSRLAALAEHSQLGAGYQIAMRDLELRGAGDLLSMQQSGHVTRIGLHLYTQMLASAVHKLKTNAAQPAAAPDGDQDEFTPVAAAQALPANITAGALAMDQLGKVLLDLAVPAYLPEAWLPDMSLRLVLYRRIAALNTSDDVAHLADELRDRFGALPLAVQGLLYQIEVKLRALTAGATHVLVRDGTVSVRLPYLPHVNRERLAVFLNTKRTFGIGFSVSRVAIQFPATEDWQARLIGLLTWLGQTRPRVSDSSAEPAPNGTPSQRRRGRG